MARVICTQIATLSSDTVNLVSNTSTLWDFVLGGYYGTESGVSYLIAYRARTQRRTSKRLRRTTAKEDVIHTHLNLRDQTEFALQEVAEMAIYKRPKTLSLARLRGILTKYGPTINITQRSAIGGTFLVDCCRARCEQ